MSPNSALSQTLKSLTLSKIRELEKQRDAYESRKCRILADINKDCVDVRQRVARVLAGTKELFPNASKDATISNIERWLDQSRYDSSIPQEMLQAFERQLLAKLDAHSRKLSLAHLYSRLLTEWTDPTGSSSNNNSGQRIDERQKQRLQQLCDQFEAAVFEPMETSEAEIHKFLNGLFPTDESAQVLDELREKVRDLSTTLWEADEPFDGISLSQCIRGLLTEDLLSEEKQGILKDFLQNEVALMEIADVLNMRYADLKNWDWHAGENGIPVLPRQQLNGKYRIWMDEDVLQTIFVQYIGIRLCNFLKSALKDFIRQPSIWTWSQGPQMAKRDSSRREYYLGLPPYTVSVEKKRKTDYVDTFFLSQLPLSEATLYEGGAGYDDVSQYSQDEEDGEEERPPPKKKDDNDQKKNIRQQLLRKLATEVFLHRHLNGQAAAVQSDLKWFGTSLPHSTIFAVMRFIGFTEDWIDFFRKYFQSPLNMAYSSEERTHTGPRIRRRGVPMAHASEKFTGELVLFFMDLAVNHEAGMLLYRIHDDLWLCGEPRKCARAWEVIQKFTQVMGLELNHRKTGSVYLAESPDPETASRLPKGPVTIGFLTLDATSGNWVIDQAQVDAHVQQLQTQLDTCDSVISWIRTWNSCIGRFFSNTFGQPAFCFGRQHIDSILATYEKMQNTLFDPNKGSGATVTEHLRQMIHARFGVSDIPDAFFFLPEQLGGLGLRNPFVSIFLVRDAMEKTPTELLEEFLDDERKVYAADKKEFEELGDRILRQRLSEVHPDDISDDEREKFMSFGEYTRFRESTSHRLGKLYDQLMEVPQKQDIQLTQEVQDALSKVRSQIQDHNLDSEKKWILQLYANELLEKCGGVSLVDKKFLPVGVLAMVQGKKVTWQMVL